MAVSLSRAAALAFSSSAFSSGEALRADSFTLAAASSIRSIALSGKKRSERYRFESVTAVRRASSSMERP